MRSIQLQGAFGQEAFTEGNTTMTAQKAGQSAAGQATQMAADQAARLADQERLRALSRLSQLETYDLPNATKAYEDAVIQKKSKIIKNSLKDKVNKIEKEIADIKIKYNM